jgi:hypothetical protein
MGAGNDAYIMARFIMGWTKQAVNGGLVAIVGHLVETHAVVSPIKAHRSDTEGVPSAIRQFLESSCLS